MVPSAISPPPAPHTYLSIFDCYFPSTTSTTTKSTSTTSTKSTTIKTITTTITSTKIIILIKLYFFQRRLPSKSLITEVLFSVRKKFRI
jgi:hypothetical protein